MQTRKDAKEAKEAKKKADEDAKSARRAAKVLEAQAKEAAREAKIAEKSRRQRELAGTPEVVVNTPGASSAAAENADEPLGVTEEEHEDWLGDEGEEDELQEVQRTAEEAAIIILDGDDDEDGDVTNWDSGAPVRPPPLNPEGKEDLEAWKVVTFTHTLKRAMANYTVQADYIMENMRVYIENFPLRIAAYYDPVDGLDLMRLDRHKMGKCLGPESSMCEHCIHRVAVYTKEERVDIALRCWGFFYLPNHQEEIGEALLRT